MASDNRQDETVSAEVIADLWPEPETRPKWAMKCRRCRLIYTTGSHEFDCPERPLKWHEGYGVA